MQPEALEADVREGLVGWALTGVGTMGQQKLRDLEAEAVDHWGLLLVPTDSLTEQEDDACEYSVPIFGGSLDVCPSLQEEPDVVCVVDLHPVTAGQSMQQRCLPILVSCVDICAKIQEALQAGQAFRFLTGQIQGAALVDPVPPVDISPVAHQQLHHVRLVSQDSNVQCCVVGDRVFKVEVGPTLQEDSSCPGQAQLGHLQQSIAHTFLVEWRVGLLLQQLRKGQDPALLTGSVTAPRGRTDQVGTLGDQWP